MTLNEFCGKYTKSEKNIPSAFMRVSAAKWLEITAKRYNGKFKPDIRHILRFSDADENYNFDYDAVHNSFNPNVTVGEMLRIAYQLIRSSYEFEYDDPKRACQMINDASYIVNCIMVYPFTKAKISA